MKKINPEYDVPKLRGILTAVLLYNGCVQFF